ncbi:MAG: GNAT family N-acetyltransferase [Armatimonadota bacterium]|nr:GNAT family N-acetyltransferase [Armatimonadota bacterium]
MITRVAQEKDVPEIVDLLVSVFPRHARSRLHWDWSHSDNRGVAVVAEHENRIIGHYSFGYYPFRWRGRAYTAGYGQQAAVHPEHRDLRTIVELIKFAQQSASAKCDFVFAFPNGNMAPLKERLLGWKKVMTFPTLSLPLSDFGRRVRERAKKASDRGSVRRLTTFSGVDCPDRGTEDDGDVLTPVKNAKWFEWRYIAHPLNHYACFGAIVDDRCEGVMALKTYSGDEERLGHVLELRSRGGLQPKLRLLSAAADFFEFMGVDRVAIWSQYKPNQRLYESLGFEASKSSSTLYAKALTENLPDLAAADWSFDMGVSDVF